tara:strand:- start:78 stop:644 length:567 start_codon:yes stop_codon:yes gene_type:complete
MEITQNQNKATGEIVDLIASAIGKNREVHSATAIATSARLSGSFLFKSFELKIDDAKPGTAVLSQEANEQGPELINVIGVVLSNMGVTVDNDKMESAEIQKTELDFLESLSATQAKANGIMNKHKLNEKEMAVACAMSTAFIIQQCQNDVEVESGFNTAVYGLIEGSKTVPPEITKLPTEQKKWYKFW